MLVELKKMPRNKMLLSLREMVVARVSEMMLHSCVAIERKYEQSDWSSSLEDEVNQLQEFLLSNISHLWEDVFQAVFAMWKNRFGSFSVDCNFKVKLFRILANLLIHKHLKKLKFPTDLGLYDIHIHILKKHLNILSRNLIAKLKNVSELDIREVKVTDEMMNMIGHSCTALKEIHLTSDSELSSLESLSNLLLKCSELEVVKVEFEGWEVEEYTPYVLKFLTELPKLKQFLGLYDAMTNILLKLTSETSIQLLDGLRVSNAIELKNVIKMCPYIQQLNLNIVSKTPEERHKVLNVLAECSLQISTLFITQFTFGKSMDCLLEQKGSILTRIALYECEGSGTTLRDIYTVGVNCPNLRDFSISEHSYENQYYNALLYPSPPLASDVSIATSPPMFCELQDLDLILRREGDIRLLLQILLHAKSLKRMILENVFPHGLQNQDILAQILRVNPLTELESLCIEKTSDTYVTSPISRDSIERLLVSSPKLTILELLVPLEHEAYFFMAELSSIIDCEYL